MIKQTYRYLLVLLVSIAVIIFGQNCGGNFKTLEGENEKASSIQNTDDVSPVPDSPGPFVSEFEKLGFSGRIPAGDFMFPLDASSSLTFPATLSETKLFKDLNTMEAVSGLMPFEVIVPLWSDGAIKKRWLALPEGTDRIQFSESENWDFPVGTIMVKQFDLRLSPSVVRKLETRVFLREVAGWKGYSYKWNDQQTDAVLLDGNSAVSETYTIEDISGNQNQQTWNYPSRAQCIQCHSNSGFVLGPRTTQMNRVVQYNTGKSFNQLTVMKQLKLISDDMPNPDSLEAFPELSDVFMPVNARARAYLSVNCSTCHSGAAPPAGVRLHHTLDLSGMNILNITANNNMGLGMGAVRLKAKDKANSTLYLRMNTTEATRMPKVGSTVIDPVGIALIGEWIDSL